MLDTNSYVRKRLLHYGWIWTKVELKGYNGADAFGLFDWLAITPLGIMGIQSTSRSNAASHRDKFVSHELAPNKKLYTMQQATQAWLSAGGLIELWLFDKPRNTIRIKREAAEMVDGILTWRVVEDGGLVK